MAEIDIESLLRSTASATRYPVTPDLRLTVTARLQDRGDALTLTLSQRGEGTRWWRPGLSGVSRLAAAAVLIAALGSAVALAVEPSREAIARFFGVQGSKIEVLPAGAFPTPVPTIALRDGGPAAPRPLSALVSSGVAEAVPLGVLAAETGFAPALPQGFGSPEQAYVVRYGQDRVAALEYATFEVWQARLEGDASFGKVMPPEGILEQVRVGGQPAYWLSGAPHFVSYNDRFGRYIDASLRLVEKNTLIWRTDYAFYRIETGLPLEEALRIAVTLP